MRLNRFLPIATILAFTAAILIAQPPAGFSGRGGRGFSGRGFGRGPNFSGPPETISVAYPGTQSYTEAVEKLVTAVKAAKSKPNKKDAAALEEQLRAVLIPPPPATPPANPGPPPPDRLKTGAAAIGEHGEFVFAIETDKQPEIEITNIKTTLPRAKAWQAGKLWVYQASL